MTDALFFETDACNFRAVVSSTGPVHSGDNCTARQHDTAPAYRRGCRCPQARAAISRYEQQRQLDILHGQQRTLPNVGALRRLHALRALGWPSRELARRIGVDERNIARWPHRTWISRHHHDAVCQVYTELAATRGPDERARRHAQRKGWLPPLWWDDDTIDDPTHTPPTVHHLRWQQDPLDVDDVAVERRIAGDTTVALTVAEKTAAIHQLIDNGVSLSEVGHRLGINSFYVRKYAEGAA